MRPKTTQANELTLLPLAVVLWLGYLLALLLVDQLFYRRPIFPGEYYLVNGPIAIAVGGLALWPQGRALLGRAFWPLVIGLLSVGPVVIGQLVTMRPPPNPASSPEAVLLRTMPLLLMALILTAWRYGWRYVILFSGGVGLLSVGLHLFFFRPGGPALWPPITVVVIQTISFLVAGYFISTLMNQLKQKQDSLTQANAQLADYAATLAELTISRERNRMARELHDTLAHTLSALSVQLETVKAYWEVDPAAAQQMLDRSLEVARSGLHETRRALKSLRASPLDDLGLLLALQKMAQETAARANLKLDLSLPRGPVSLSGGVEQAIYRIAQEALANVAHHANAHTLRVHLSTNDPGIVLVIQDNGLGFNPRQRTAAGHFGLPGMRERAQLVGGELAIKSQPGQGTTVQFTVKDGLQ